MAKVSARVAFFVARKDGSEAFVGAGQELDADSELVRGREDLFDPVDPIEVAVKLPRKRTPRAKG